MSKKPQKKHTTVPSKRFDVVERWDDYVADLPSEISVERAQAEAGHVSEWVRRYDTGSMIAKFCLGTIAYLANPNWRNERKYGKSIIKKLSNKHHINANVLREARRCAEFFGLDLKSYYEWLTQEPERVKTWTEVRKLIRAWDDPDVLGPENLANRLANRIESAGNDLQKLRQQVYEGHIDEDTYEGVKDEFMRDVEDFEEVKEDALSEKDERQKTPRNEDYVEWIRTKKCKATNRAPPSEPHHTEQGGEGMKGSDYTCIPLDSEVHNYLEDHGHRAAEKKFGFSITQALAECLHEWVTKGNRPTLPPDISYRRRHDQKEATTHRTPK